MRETRVSMWKRRLVCRDLHTPRSTITQANLVPQRLRATDDRGAGQRVVRSQVVGCRVVIYQVVIYQVVIYQLMIYRVTG
jgi:hypothetical protein